ncbi:MAG TPA: HIT domain-containing protein [Bacilli bacterium]|nr:HIT domain-containing protein [Bacilli bacterium]
MDCIFCKIISGEIPSNKIYEDNNVITFLDIHPDSNGHTLIVPKKHITDIYDIDDQTLLYINESIKMVSKLLKDKLYFDGFTVIQNNGDIQDIKHYHVHIKPFYKIEQDILNVKEIYEKIMN